MKSKRIVTKERVAFNKKDDDHDPESGKFSMESTLKNDQK